MFCRNCGRSLDDSALFCPSCGQAVSGEHAYGEPVRREAPSAGQSENGMAIAGFVCSFFIAILGLIFGCIGLKQSKELGGKGRSFAIAAIVISSVELAAVVIAVLFYVIAFIAVMAGGVIVG